MKNFKFKESSYMQVDRIVGQVELQGGRIANKIMRRNEDKEINFGSIQNPKNKDVVRVEFKEKISMPFGGLFG